MPHFIIDCSQELLDLHSPDKIMAAVYDTAEASGLFAKDDIKVRIRPYQYYQLGNGKDGFIHIFGNIMEGRSSEEKSALSKKIIEQLSMIFPEVSFLSMNINEFDAATYCNRSLINPDNTRQDRHFKED